MTLKGTGTTVKYVLEQDKAAFTRLIGGSILQSVASSFVAPSLRYHSQNDSRRRYKMVGSGQDIRTTLILSGYIFAPNPLSLSLSLRALELSSSIALIDRAISHGLTISLDKSISSKAGDTGQKSFYSSYDAQTHQRPSAITSFLDSQNSGAYFPAKITSLQDLKRTRPPQLLSTNEDCVRNTRKGNTRMLKLMKRLML
ncbi:ABC transporter D family member 1 [Camellia lanceoleosa]|uniref:ABC transporter D family member 1 n=1 Tax=Camellia lanceoleosa TaxID=1840588 RepID=A0ACC0H4U2_9ERIC|nr:ABC transporter D family member 1 [Camellia lanceoleosa]